jgi:hypothetical protein
MREPTIRGDDDRVGKPRPELFCLLPAAVPYRLADTNKADINIFFATGRYFKPVRSMKVFTGAKNDGVIIAK